MPPESGTLLRQGAGGVSKTSRRAQWSGLSTCWSSARDNQSQETGRACQSGYARASEDNTGICKGAQLLLLQGRQVPYRDKGIGLLRSIPLFHIAHLRYCSASTAATSTPGCTLCLSEVCVLARTKARTCRTLLYPDRWACLSIPVMSCVKRTRSIVQRRTTTQLIRRRYVLQPDSSPVMMQSRP